MFQLNILQAFYQIRNLFFFFGSSIKQSFALFGQCSQLHFELQRKVRSALHDKQAESSDQLCFPTRIITIWKAKHVFKNTYFLGKCSLRSCSHYFFQKGSSVKEWCPEVQQDSLDLSSASSQAAHTHHLSETTLSALC